MEELESRTIFHHLFFISGGQVLFGVFNEESHLVYFIERRVPVMSNLSETSLAISQIVSEIAGSLPLFYRAVYSTNIVYGSPWASTLIEKHKTSIGKKIETLPAEKIKSSYDVMSIHGALYPTTNNMIATSIVDAGYVVGGVVLPELPKGQVIESEHLCIVDWISSDIHKAVLSSLYPLYLQSEKLLATSLEGIMTSLMIATLDDDDVEESLLVIGGYSSLLIRIRSGGDSKQVSLPLGYLSGLERGRIEASQLTLSKKLEGQWNKVLANGLEELFPEALSKPSVLISYEPHPRAVELAKTCYTIEAQGVYPKWNMVPFDDGVRPWLETLFSHII